MDFLEIVREARSCRRFDEQAGLPEGCLEWLVDCARLVPSARNQQVLRYVTIESKEARAAFFPCVCWAGALPDWDGPEEGERPSGYLVMCAPKDSGPTVRIDMGIAGQTIQLASQSRGLAACMILSFDAQKVTEQIPLPEGLVPAMVIAIGKPVETRKIVAIPKSGNVNYWREPDQIHCVPKRSMEEVLVGTL